MAARAFSHQALGLIAQVMPEYFSQTGLDTVLLKSGAPTDSAGGSVSKQRKVLNVINALRGDPGDQSDAILQAIAEELLGRVTNNGDRARTALARPELDLVEAIERDGFYFDGTRLLAVDDTGAQGPPGNADLTAIIATTTVVDDFDLTTSSKVFVVHGRDDGTKEAVARFVEHLGFEAVILHERPNIGRTLLEKFTGEAADAAFALVLLTADDVGGLASGSQNPRARQNVVLEFGYFLGLLGRERVIALVEVGLELPSDISGLVYIEIDRNSAWRMSVAREMRAVGLNVDLNRV